MEREKLIDIVKNYKSSGNKDLEEVRKILKADFDATKKDVIQLTYYLDNLKAQHDKINDELKKRLNNG
jgi:hypothetical protein|tara:strand:- start:460 stop:663 length:204 start_codon:yes stop_codon:yes gene_type:complete